MRLALLMVTSAALIVATLGVAPSARAGDHLACYKVKDTLAKNKFTAVTLTSNDGGPNQTGCTISTGAKLCCDPVDKSGVPPQPGGSGPGAPITRFCCYTVKCAKGPTANLAFTDQFGNRALPVTTPKMICAPVPPPTTTTTTTTVTTTTSPGPTCANGGLACGDPCGGACGGICLAGDTSTCATGIHCGSSAPICIPPEVGTPACTTDASCPAGNVCIASPNAAACGSGQPNNGCIFTCPE